MKPYLLFMGSRYYPNGGWEDFKGSYDSLEEALFEQKRLVEINEHTYPWWQIIRDGEFIANETDNGP